MRSGIRRLVVGSLVVGLMAVVAATAGAGEPVPLARITIRNPEALLDKIASLAEKFVPGTGAQVKAGLGEPLGKAKIAGVDLSKPMTIAVYSGKAYGQVEPVLAVVVPIADAAKFAAARETDVDLKEGKVRIKDGFVIFSTSAEGLAAVTETRFKTYSKYPLVAGNTDVYITMYIASAITEYQTDIDQGLEQLQNQMADAPMMGPQAAIAGTALKVLGPVAKLVGKEARRASIMLQFNDSNVEIQGRLYAVKESELEAFFDGQPAESTDLVKYLPADAVFSAAGKLDISKLRPLVEKTLETVSGPLAMKPDDQQAILSLVFGSTQTGEFAGVMVGGAEHQGIQTVNVVKITDGAKFRTASKEGTDWLMKSGFGALMGALGVQFEIDHKPNHREYKQIAVDRLTMTVQGGAAGMPQAPPQVTEMAAAGTFGITSSNNEAGDLVNGAIDRIQDGAPGFSTSKTYQALKAGAPQNANVMFHVSFNGLVAKIIEQVSKQMPLIKMMVGPLAQAVPDEKPIAGYVAFAKYRSGSAINFTVRIPHDPLVTFAGRIRKMMQQGGGPGGIPGMPPARDDDF